MQPLSTSRPRCFAVVNHFQVTWSEVICEKWPFVSVMSPKSIEHEGLGESHIETGQMQPQSA